MLKTNPLISKMKGIANKELHKTFLIAWQYLKFKGRNSFERQKCYKRQKEQLVSFC